MSIFFSFLRTKMLNHVNRSLYGEKERVFILFVLMLGTKTLTYIQSSLYKETYQYYQRICIMGIFEKKKMKKKSYSFECFELKHMQNSFYIETGQHCF